MPLKLELELTDQDLCHFRRLMRESWQRNATRDESKLLEEARRWLAKARTLEAPEHVKKRLDDLGTLLAMLDDADWPLEEKDRRRIVAALSYFADAADGSADRIRGLGFLDDALMTDVVAHELAHDLQGYREFAAYREKEHVLHGKEHVDRQDWLAAKRRQIRLNMHDLWQQRMRHGSTDGPTDPILAYMSEPY